MFPPLQRSGKPRIYRIYGGFAAVEAACSKHRKRDVLPVDPELVALLPDWLSELGSDELLFPDLARQKTWFMVQKDLERVGIPYRTHEGVADFHAAGRHSYVTNLLRAGVSVTEAKELARHVDIRMTMRYTHHGLNDQARALQMLPALQMRCISGGGACQDVALGGTTQVAQDACDQDVSPYGKQGSAQKNTDCHQMAQSVLDGGGGN